MRSRAGVTRRWIKSYRDHASGVLRPSCEPNFPVRRPITDRLRDVLNVQHTLISCRHGLVKRTSQKFLIYGGPYARGPLASQQSVRPECFIRPSEALQVLAGGTRVADVSLRVCSVANVGRCGQLICITELESFDLKLSFAGFQLFRRDSPPSKAILYYTRSRAAIPRKLGHATIPRRLRLRLAPSWERVFIAPPPDRYIECGFEFSRTLQHRAGKSERRERRVNPILDIRLCYPCRSNPEILAPSR